MTEHFTTSSPGAKPQAANKYQVALLTPQLVHDNWDQIGGMLEKIDFEDHDLQTLYDALVDPDIRFYLMAVLKNGNIRALVGVELLETALRDRWLNVAFVSGKDTVQWLEIAEPTILAWAQKHGCTKATGRFRKFFKKYLKPMGWQYTHDYLEKDLA